MDGSNWKRILLHWVNQTSLFERPYYNIEQTDVELFFEKFRCHMKTTPTDQRDLVIFLKEKYPEFEVHLNDDGSNVSSTDYMYVYSLLLHYSCVKCPDAFFHEVCQSLPEQFQQAIAAFFKMLIESENFSRETLRHAIHTSSPKSPIRFLPLESPIRTPRSKISPPTPKTTMLEERTKELNLLKAQLESEKYEKGFLELQLKQNEEKIQKLTQEQKNHLAEIYTLKNELLVKNTENLSPNKNYEEEQIKKRLRKDIAEKEETILNLRENLESLGEEKSLILEKLIYAENQVAICLDKIKEMDYIINELKSEIEKRDLAIQTLTETKNELELFISESRSSSQGGRNDFNASVECLDVSMTRTSNSSGSLISSPENLGVSVIDVKLREKENENAILLERIELMKGDCQKLSKHVCELIVRYADTFQICSENLVVADDADLTHTFLVFENYIEKIVESYKVTSGHLNTTRDENSALKAQNEELMKKIGDFEEQLNMLRSQIKTMQSEKTDLECRNELLASQSLKFQADIKNLNEKHLELQASLNQVSKEHEEAKKSYNDKVYQLTATNFNIESQLNSVLEEIAKAKTDNVQLEVDKRVCEEQILELEDQLKEKSKKLHELEENNRNLLMSIATHIDQIRHNEMRIGEFENVTVKLERAIETLNEEKDTLLDQNEVLQSNFEETKNALSKLESEYAIQVANANYLKDEVTKLTKTLAETEDKLHEKSLINNDLEDKLTETNKIISELKANIACLDEGRNIWNRLCDNLQKDIQMLNAKLDEKEKIIQEKDKDYLNYCKNKETEMKIMKSEFNSNLMNLENKIRDYKFEIEKLEEERNAIQCEAYNKNEEVNRLNSLIKEIEVENASSEDQLRNEKQALEEQIATLWSKSSELEDELLSLLKLQESCMDSNSGDSHAINYNPCNVEETVKYLKERLSNLISTNNELSKSGENLRAVINDLRDKNSELKKSGEELNAICKSLTEDVAHFESKILDMECDKKALTKVFDELKIELQETKNTKEMLERERAQSEHNIKQLHETINNLNSDKNFLSSDLTSLKINEKNLADKIAELQHEINVHVKSEDSLTEKLTASEKHLTELSEKQMQLEKQLVEREDTIVTLKEEREMLTAELKSHQQSASEETKKFVQIQKENNEFMIELNKRNKDIAELIEIESEFKVLKEEYERLKKEMEEKDRSLATASKEISVLTESQAILKSKQNGFEKDMADSEAKLKELHDVLNSRDARIKQLEQILLDNNTNLAELKAQITKLESIIKEKEANIEEWRQLLATADAESKTLSDKYKETVENLEIRINNLEKERSALESSKSLLTDNLIEIEESLKQAQTVNVELLAKIDELKSSNSEATQRETDYINLQLSYVSLKAERDQLISSKQKLEENCTKLTKRVEKLSIKLGDLQANASKLERFNTESRNEIENLQKTFRQNKMQIEDLQSRLSTSQKDLKTANEEVSNLKKMCDTSAAKSNNLEAEVQQLRIKSDNNSTIQRDLKVASERASNLQKLYNEEVVKTVALSRELNELRTQLERKQTELERHHLILDDLKCELENKQETIEKLNAEFENISDQNNQLQEKNKVLAEKIQTLSAAEAKLQDTEKMLEAVERQKSSLKARLDELLTSEENLKEATSHIDNIKHELELKVGNLSTTLEKMSCSLQMAHLENTSLLNENNKLKRSFEDLCNIVQPIVIKIEKTEELKVNDDYLENKYNELVHNIKELNTSKQGYEMENSRLTSELEASREENSQLSDKLSKLSIRLQILEKENIELGNEIKDIQTAYDTLRSEKETIEQENEGSLNSLQAMESRQNEIFHEHVTTKIALKEQLARYEIQLNDKTQVIDKLEQQLQEAKNDAKARNKEYLNEADQFAQLEKKFRSLEQQYEVEREQNEKLKKDIAIFQAKLFKNRQLTEEKEKQWQEERGKLKSEIKLSEDRIKDNRLELEGKLEKMKNKMKTIYNDEVTKIKNKHERVLSEYKAQVEDLTKQNKKYETHIQKLAKQLFNQNDSILELQKQNLFMETRLKDLESIPASTLRRQSQFASQMIGSNLRMEDEEGEMFNNTYLADLKSGRMSPFGRESVSVNELHYRNSLAPPHLRSTYIAQYPDHHLREEDIKDVPINLDDSLSSLLHAGQRKKMSGTTSYKKPGPPTPSKNGGRLSFGAVGSGDPPREILKESNDISVTNSKKATPSKFRNMFSSSKLRDENTPPKRRLSNLFQRKK